MHADKVTVWPDEFAEGGMVWIVSLDTDDGDTETSSVHPDRQSAIDAGQLLAADKSLPLFEQDRFGIPTEIK
jgi:hypothetical protein